MAQQPWQLVRNELFPPGAFQPIRLNRQEIDLINELSPHFYKTNSELRSALWGDRKVADSSVQMLIYRFRRKLPAGTELIQNVFGQGYRLAESIEKEGGAQIQLTGEKMKNLIRLLETHPDEALADKVFVELGLEDWT